MGDPKDIKPGDEVTVKVIARSPSEGSSPYQSGVLYYGNPGDVLWGPKEIVDFKTPEKPWAVGDRYEAWGLTWEVVFMDDISVLVEQVGTSRREHLRRVDFPAYRVRVST